MILRRSSRSCPRRSGSCLAAALPGLLSGRSSHATHPHGLRPLPLPCGKRQHSERAILTARLTSCPSLRRPCHGAQGERCFRDCYRFSDGIQLAFVDTYRAFTKRFQIAGQPRSIALFERVPHKLSADPRALASRISLTIRFSRCGRIPSPLRECASPSHSVPARTNPPVRP